MHIEFTPTLEDLEETLSPTPASGHPAPKPASSLRTKGFFSWLLFILFAIMLIVLVHNQQRHRTTAAAGRVPIPPTAGPSQDLLATLLPSLLPCMFFSVFLAAALANQRRTPSADVDAAHRRSMAFAKLTAILLAGTIILGAFCVLIPTLTIPWHPTRNRQLLVGFLPWIAFILLFCLLFRSNRTARVQWNNSPSLRAPKSVDADPTSLTFSTSHTTFRYLWPHFTTFRETQNLFVLTSVDHVIHFLPKRAFPDPHSLDLFRGLLQTALPSGTTLPAPSAFPVVLPHTAK